MFSKSTKILRIIIPLTFLLSATVVFAAPSWWPIVPCGLSVQPSDPGQPGQDYTQPCNPCELFHLGRNIIDFVLMGLMPPVAAGLFIWGGFLILMGGPNPALFAKGKEIFTTTFYGVLIILGSWLITNTIMMSVAKDSIEVNGTTVNIVTDWNKFKCEYTPTVPAPTTGTLIILPESLPDAVINITQYGAQLSVAPNSTGISPYKWSQSGSLPAGLSFNASAATITGTPTQSGNFNFTIKVEDSSTAQKSTGTRTYSINVGGLMIRTISPLSDATVGQEYTQIFMAEGGMSRTYEWSFEGTVPEELAGKLGTGGGLKFTPTIGKTLSFTVKVKDATTPTALTASKTFTLKIGATTACDVRELAPSSCSDAGQCPDCQPITGTSLRAAQSMASLLNSSLFPAFNRAKLNYRLAEAMCPQSKHNNCSHFNGHAVDIGGLSEDSLKTACGILNGLGLRGVTETSSGDRGVYIVEVNSPGLPCPETCGGAAGKCGASPIHLQY